MLAVIVVTRRERAVVQQDRHAALFAGGATAICGASAALALRRRSATARRPGISHADARRHQCRQRARDDALSGECLRRSSPDRRAGGFLIGASIHDVAQAIGGGFSFRGGREVKTIVKLGPASRCSRRC
jgi:uncharacterized membrane protein YadS